MTIDMLSQMLHAQYRQQQEIMGPLPGGRAEQHELARDFGLYLIDEVYEYLHTIGYKRFLSAKEGSRSNRVEEIVDVLKYAFAICWTEGVTPEELFQAFRDKTQVVDQRFTESQLSSKVCGFDIDGVLAEYGTWGPSEGEFIETGGVLTLQPLDGAKKVLDWLKSDGWSIVIVTARKRHIYQRLEHDTHEWFAMHEIPYDRILWGYDKMEAIKHTGAAFSFHVEDSLKHAIDVSEGGVPTFLLAKGHAATGDRLLQSDRIMRIERLEQVRYYVENGIWP